LKGKFLMCVALGIGVSILSLPLLAHHGVAAYDMTKNITLKATVTEWVWSNPHCILQFDVTDDRGQVVQWTAETENPSSMIHQGWTRQSMKPGDQITVTVYQAKNGKPIARIIGILLPNGQKLAGRGIQGPTKEEDYLKQ
jgi:Family of unknown function (DUF6152)